ncbi:MAG: hypothetical protein R3C69_04310 [Geminicoccaceae bacterium]
MAMILRKRLILRGFIVFQDFGHLYPEFAQQMGAWVEAGRVRYLEDMIEGLEQAAALVGLLRASRSASAPSA